MPFKEIEKFGNLYVIDSNEVSDWTFVKPGTDQKRLSQRISQLDEWVIDLPQENTQLNPNWHGKIKGKCSFLVPPKTNFYKPHQAGWAPCPVKTTQ